MNVRRTLIAGVLSSLTAATAGAQTIRGTVVDAADRPVSGVLVMMLDSASNVAARALSNERGEFRVANARAGSYRLRTMRIGFRPATSDPIALPAGGEVTQRIVLSGAQFVLDTVRVMDHNSCRITSDSAAAATFAVWEQARTALTAAQLTATGRTITATTVAYDRTLEPDGRRVLQQSSRIRTDYVTQPWRAAGPDSLHRAGFVVTDRNNTTTYHAPSIEVLLSNVFIEDHCFRLRTDRGHPGMLGIAFEPSPDRRTLAEIHGTLWVDKKSAELRKLDFRYANVSAEQELAGAGGDMNFARMANGGWAITRWDIRMPELEQSVRTQAMGGVQVHVADIKVNGGELALATMASPRGRDTLWSRPPLVLGGTVQDSASGTVIAGARVSLAGTALEARTDARGRFQMSGVLPGIYTLETRTPALDAIGAANQTPVSFLDSTTTVQVRVPSAEQLAATLCGTRASATTGMIVGRVYQRGDSSARKATPVVAEWEGKRLDAATDASGAFRLCGVPLNTAITVRAASDSARSAPMEIRVADSRFARADLTMDQRAAAGSAFSGAVLDSAKKPIAGAEVTFPDLSKSVTTDQSGVFRVTQIPAGTHHVIVRHLGYGSLDTALPFDGTHDVDRTVYLSRATRLDSVIVNASGNDPLMKDFENNRRLGVGKFVTRAELARQEGRKLGDVISELPGARQILGSNSRGWIYSSRNDPCPSGSTTASCRVGGNVYMPTLLESQLGMKAKCYALVFLDGILMTPGHPAQPFDVSSIDVAAIEAVEYYAGGAGIPLRYQGQSTDCGVVVLHTRRAR